MAKHTQSLHAFLNSLVQKGVKLETVEAIKTAIPEEAHDALAEGVMAEADYHRAQNQLSQERSQFESSRQQWQTWYQNAQSQFDQTNSRLTRAEAALRAAQVNYQIPEEEISQYLGGQTSPPNPNSQPRTEPRTEPRVEDLDARFRSHGLELIDAIAERDEIAARHFELTGKPLNSRPVLEYMKEQARVGRALNFEQAWRQLHSIDSLEQAAADRAREEERARIRAEIESELAAKSALPSDPTPNFQHANVSRIFSSVVEGEQAERGGRHDRTRRASEALLELQRRRQMGLPTQYEQPA